jgi:hypothetical protein
MGLVMRGGGEMRLVERGQARVRGLVRDTHHHLLGSDEDAGLRHQMASEVGAEAHPGKWRRWITRQAAAGPPPGMQFKVRYTPLHPPLTRDGRED